MVNQTAEEIEEEIEKLKAQIEYEEKRLKYCAYGKSDLYFIEGLKNEVEKLEKMLEEMEE